MFTVAQILTTFFKHKSYYVCIYTNKWQNENHNVNTGHKYKTTLAMFNIYLACIDRDDMGSKISTYRACNPFT